MTDVHGNGVATLNGHILRFEHLRFMVLGANAHVLLAESFDMCADIEA